MSSLTDPQVADIHRLWDAAEWELAQDFVGAEERKLIWQDVLERSSGRRPGTGVGMPIPKDEEREPFLEELRSRGRHNIRKFLKANKQLFCERLKWCEMQAKLGTEGPALALAVADGLLSAATAIPLPITSVSVYVVKTRALNPLCGCTKAA